MATVAVPDFASILSAQPLSTGPSGAAVWGPMVAQSLLSVGASLSKQRKTKDALAGFAEAVGETDPETAAIYQSMADSTPALDLSVVLAGSGFGAAAGGGGRGGGGGGGIDVGDVMQDMLKLANTKREEASELRLQNNRLQNQKTMALLQSHLEAGHQAQSLKNALSEIQARTGAEKEILGVKGDQERTDDERASSMLDKELKSKEEYRGLLERQITQGEEENKLREAGKYSQRGSGAGGKVMANDVLNELATNPAYKSRFDKLFTTINSRKKEDPERVKAEREMLSLKAEVQRNLESGSVPSTTFDYKEALRLGGQ